MTAALAPRVGERYLYPTEVIGRMKLAFAYVETSEEGAREKIQEWMSQLAFVAADGRTEECDADLDRLDQLQDAALYVHFGDEVGDDATLLSMFVVPTQPIFVDPLTGEDREKAAPLIERCAAALGYEVVEV
ncbi:MAG: hypothetical protein ACT4PS_09885 [Betaproteobacteria bacterium]